ncbi:cobalt-precorrin-5B (C(1))-methyltransferase [Lacrimispora xylanisolvens]|uniref:cobalt-precorrin-5B (C(1))-methyltransferase n=1 Tax=Lacrimispora xylanisolvens TaxID=384636 RepID=UPI002402D9FC
MDKRELRCGFTTGTCAAVAAKAAAAMLLMGNQLQHMKLMTPKGTEADLPLFSCCHETGQGIMCGEKRCR